jgi:hypothetical protein
MGRAAACIGWRHDPVLRPLRECRAHEIVSRLGQARYVTVLRRSTCSPVAPAWPSLVQATPSGKPERARPWRFWTRIYARTPNVRPDRRAPAGFVAPISVDAESNLARP